MASRRKLKKSIKEQTNLLIEDAFIETLNGDAKMDKVIDELIDKRFDILAQISSYPKGTDSKAKRTHFDSVKKDLSETVISYSKKIGKVG